MLSFAEGTVDGGDETPKDDGVVLESGSKEKPPANCILGENAGFLGESPFMLIVLNVSSRPADGECLVHGDCAEGPGNMALSGDASREFAM